MANSNYSRDSNQPTFVITNESGEQVHPPIYNYFTEDDRLNRVQYVWKHRRQMGALIPGYLILAASGMHLGWSYFPKYGFLSRSMHEAIHLTLSWFIGALIGGLITAFLVRATKRTYFSYISGVIVIISGILFTVKDKNFAAILVGRYLGGIAHGIMFLTTVIHAGEVAAHKIRGFAISSLALAITSGIMVASVITSNLWTMTIDMTLNRLYGIVFILLGVIASVAARCTGSESPIYLIDNNRDDALQNLQRLRNEPPGSESARREFDELKDMVDDHKTNLNVWFFSEGNIKPLLYITASRLIPVILMLPIFFFYQYYYIIVAVKSIYGVLLLITGRFIGEICSTILMDISGRRALLQISCALSGGMVALTGYFNHEMGLVDTTEVVAILAFINQFCIGFGLSTASITYMSESFPLPKKPFSCFVCLSAEMLLYIVIISFVSTDYPYSDLWLPLISVGLIQVVVAIIFCVVFKETKNDSLKLSIDKMQGR